MRAKNKSFIRLTENDLHTIIKQSVIRILKEEYGVSPNGRPIDQSKAVKAANTPTNWEVYAQREQDTKDSNYGKSRKYRQMSDNAAFDQMRFYKKGETASEHVIPDISRGNVTYGQDNYEQLRDKGLSPTQASFSNERGMRGMVYNFNHGTTNTYVGDGKNHFIDATNSFEAPSQEAMQAANGAVQRAKNFKSGNWERNMKSKAQQLGNKGIYESRKNKIIAK